MSHVKPAAAHVWKQVHTCCDPLLIRYLSYPSSKFSIPSMGYVVQFKGTTNMHTECTQVCDVLTKASTILAL